jgi:hypothetical protein
MINLLCNDVKEVNSNNVFTLGMSVYHKTFSEIYQVFENIIASLIYQSANGFIYWTTEIYYTLYMCHKVLTFMPCY